MSLLRQQSGLELPRLLRELALQLSQVLEGAERKVEEAKRQPGSTFKPTFGYLEPFQVSALKTCLVTLT